VFLGTAVALYQYLFFHLSLDGIEPQWGINSSSFGASGELTRVGAGELLELSSLEGRAGDLHGGLGSHGGHLGGGDAEGRHFDGFEVCEMELRWVVDGLGMKVWWSDG
jgi:hypothetical protein